MVHHKCAQPDPETRATTDDVLAPMCPSAPHPVLHSSPCAFARAQRLTLRARMSLPPATPWTMVKVAVVQFFAVLY
jgi:hypothetical protein